MADALTDKEFQRLENSFGRHHGWAELYLPLLSGAIAARSDNDQRAIIQRSLDRGVSPLQLQETVYQIHLFLGFPAMIEASRLLAEYISRPRSRHRLPTAYTSRQVTSWHRSGLHKIRKVYGRLFERLVVYVNSFSPQILTWMINDGYGQVLSRPGLSFERREMCVVATLTVSGYDNQLLAHIRGALNCGATPAVLADVIEMCRYFCPRRNRLKALRILKENGTA